jgi:hypothetical protein
MVATVLAAIRAKPGWPMLPAVLAARQRHWPGPFISLPRSNGSHHRASRCPVAALPPWPGDGCHSHTCINPLRRSVHRGYQEAAEVRSPSCSQGLCGPRRVEDTVNHLVATDERFPWQTTAPHLPITCGRSVQGERGDYRECVFRSSDRSRSANGFLIARRANKGRDLSYQRIDVAYLLNSILAPDRPAIHVTPPAFSCPAPRRPAAWPPKAARRPGRRCWANWDFGFRRLMSLDLCRPLCH